MQYGASREPHGAGEWVDFLDFDVLAERMREARVVVCHAGVGSIMLARRCGHRPVVMPRRFELGEAVDDHQLQLARRLHKQASSPWSRTSESCRPSSAPRGNVVAWRRPPCGRGLPDG